MVEPHKLTAVAHFVNWTADVNDPIMMEMQRQTSRKVQSEKNANNTRLHKNLVLCIEIPCSIVIIYYFEHKYLALWKFGWNHWDNRPTYNTHRLLVYFPSVSVPTRLIDTSCFCFCFFHLCPLTYLFICRFVRVP